MRGDETSKQKQRDKKMVSNKSQSALQTTMKVLETATSKLLRASITPVIGQPLDEIQVSLEIGAAISEIIKIQNRIAKLASNLQETC